MPEPERPLAGGQMTSVVRIGDTVRRTTGQWSPAVHGLLRHLEAIGFDGAPHLLGTDRAGREVLIHIDGEAGFFSRDRVDPPNLWSDQVLIDAAALLRRFHDATIGLSLPTEIQWQPAWPTPPPHEVVCHNDFAPYNCIFRDGHLVATIDLDNAAPGSRTWDLAYAAYTFVPMYADDRCPAVGLNEPPDRGRRLRLVCDTYGLADRSGFVEGVEERVHDTMAMIRAHAAGGDIRYQRKIAEGHLDGYETDASYLRQHRRTLQAWLE